MKKKQRDCKCQFKGSILPQNFNILGRLLTASDVRSTGVQLSFGRLDHFCSATIMRVHTVVHLLNRSTQVA